jgi:hypothetical protein
MKRLKIILLFFVVNFAVNAQTFYCTKTIKLKDCKVSFANSTTAIWAQLDAKTLTWSVDQVGSYVIKDGNTQVTIKNDGCLTSPTFVALKDSLNSWQSQCVGSGGTVIPIPLIVENIGIDTVRVIDSVRVWFERNLDTSNQGILNAINATLNDSIRVYFNDVPQISDTANSAILNAIYGLLLDSLDKQLYVLNPYIDSALVRRLDSVLVKLTSTPTLDTLKALTYTAIAKVRTNRDTLYNCKSLSFGRKANASGTLILTFENGESESFDVANDDLPAWVNGEFISYLDYNATSAVGLIVNTLGCSQTSTEICAKVKPIFDCELNIPIGCLGWQSASGVWKTISGCWNTGQ